MAFEMELERIENVHTRKYMKEVISDYSNGNLRSATVMLYVVAMSDIFEKVDSLAKMYDDKAANGILNNLSKKNIFDATREETVYTETIKRIPNFISTAGQSAMESLKKWRNISAHPSLNTDAPEPLEHPSINTVAGLIHDCINFIFSQPVDPGTRSFSGFLDKVSQVKNTFPSQESLFNYLDINYFSKFQGSTYVYMIEHLFKIVFVSEDENASANRDINVVVLKMLAEKHRDIAVDTIRDSHFFEHVLVSDNAVLKYIEKFLRDFPELYGYSPNFLKETIEQNTSSDPDLRLLNFFVDSNNLSDHIDKLKNMSQNDSDFYNQVNWNRIVDLLSLYFKNSGDIQKMCNIYICAYSHSRNYREADNRFTYLIVPILESMTKNNFLTLFAIDNSQCYIRFAAEHDHKKAFDAYKRRFDNNAELKCFKREYPNFFHFVNQE